MLRGFTIDSVGILGKEKSLEALEWGLLGKSVIYVCSGHHCAHNL